MFDSDFLIMAPFNGVFWMVLLLFFLILVVATRELKNKKEETKKTVMIGASIITLIWFILYKYYLSIDGDFNLITAEIGGFNWWGELPLHLCNINMILLPIGVLFNIKPLKSMCFYVGPLGAIMAILMPSLGFNGYSILLPRMICYYGIHFMIIVEGLLLVTIGLYKPRFKDIPGTILTTIALCFTTFLVNMVLRSTGLNPDANYFFSVNPEGNPILEYLKGIIPIPFLYELPLSLILGAYMLIVTLGLHLKQIILPGKEREQEQ